MIHIELMASKRSVIRQVMTNLGFSAEIEKCSEGEGKADLLKQIREQLESKAQ